MKNNRKISVNEALSKAKKAVKQGKMSLAVELFELVLEYDSANKIAKKGLKKANQKSGFQNKECKKVTRNDIARLVQLFESGDMEQAIEVSAELIKDSPNKLILYNVRAAALLNLGLYGDVVNVCDEAIANTLDNEYILYNKAVALQHLKKLDEAEVCYEKVILIKSSFAEAYCNKGVINKEKGIISLAIDCFKKAIEYKPGYVEAYVNYSNVLIEGGENDDARNLLENAVQVIEGSPELWYALGGVLREAGELHEALNAFQKAVKIDLGFADAYIELSNVYYELKDLGEALVNCDKAIEIDAGNKKYYNHRGSLLYELKKYGLAQECYEKAIDIDLNCVEAYINLGVLLQREGKLEESIGYYKGAIRINPESSKAYCNYGVVLHELERYGESIAMYDASLCYDENFSPAHVNRGNALREVGDLSGALESYDKALNIDPFFVEAYVNRGITLKELGELNGALVDYDKAIELNVDCQEAYYNRANVLQQLFRYDEAINSYEDAILLNPNSFQTYQNYGYTLTLMRMQSDALKKYKNAIALVSDHPVVNINLSIIYWVNGNLDEVSECLGNIDNLQGMSQKELGFVRPYRIFLSALVSYRNNNRDLYVGRGDERALHLIGESHSLTPANIIVNIEGDKYRVVPHPIIGCKAWHLANENQNKYKLQFEKIVEMIPSGDKVVIIVGEIDCRNDEGIIKHHKKTNDDLFVAISELSSSYVDYVSMLFVGKGSDLMFAGVPAMPSIYKGSGEILSNTITMFNSGVMENSIDKGCGFLDLYARTYGKPEQSFLDDYHLQPDVFVCAVELDGVWKWN